MHHPLVRIVPVDDVPIDATLQGGVEVNINLETGTRLARRLHRDG